MPQMDYELEQALAERALKEAQALRGAKVAPSTTSTGAVNWLGAVDRLSQQTQGNQMEDQSTNRMRELSTAQQAEIDPLVKQLMTPGVALRQGEGPLLDPTRPMDATEENQRQGSIGAQLMMLPKSRAIGTQFLNSSVGFPEKMATLEKTKQLEAEKERMRLADRAEQNRLNRENTMAIAQANIAGRQGDAQLRSDERIAAATEKAVAKQAEGNDKRDAAITMAEQGIQNIDNMIGQRDAEGKLIAGAKPHPGFQGYVGATLLPGARLIPGTDAASYSARHEQVTGQARLEGVQAMKGAGAVSNAEGAAAASAISRMSGSQSEPEYIQAALEYRNIMQKAVERNKRGMKVTPDGKEYSPTTQAVNPTTPTNFPRVTAGQQSGRDGDRLTILKQELAYNPGNADLIREIAKEEGKKSPFTPNRGDPSRPSPVATSSRTVDFGSLK